MAAGHFAACTGTPPPPLQKLGRVQRLIVVSNTPQVQVRRAFAVLPNCQPIRPIKADNSHTAISGLAATSRRSSTAPQTVTDRQQAIAIALNEAGLGNKPPGERGARDIGQPPDPNLGPTTSDPNVGLPATGSPAAIPRVHLFQRRVWPRIMVGVMFVLEVLLDRLLGEFVD
jgi:hypothetical protein